MIHSYVIKELNKTMIVYTYMNVIFISSSSSCSNYVMLYDVVLCKLLQKLTINCKFCWLRLDVTHNSLPDSIDNNLFHLLYLLSFLRQNAIGVVALSRVLSVFWLLFLQFFSISCGVDFSGGNKARVMFDSLVLIITRQKYFFQNSLRY